MRYLIPALLLLAACSQTQQRLTTSRAAPSPDVILEAKNVQTKSIDVSAEKAEELYRLLGTLGVKPVTVERTTYLSVYDLACSLDLPKEGPKCEFYTRPPEQKSRKMHTVRGKAQYEQLRTFLFGYPVEQGDPGAVSHFVQCRKYSYTKAIDCYLAIHVNYEGP
jgi:hypothetical protein